MIAITVDIEDWYHLPSITGTPYSKYKDVPTFFNNWKSRYDYLRKPTERVLDMLQELDIKATFFVVADVVEHCPGLVEKISEGGHEIACHGLHHACKINPRTKESLMSKAEFKTRTLQAKIILEKASGLEVKGYRAPNAYVSGWMIDILEELGFKYDSSVSVNSFYNKTDSKLIGVNCSPYYPKHGRLDNGEVKRGIIEIPWPYFQVFLRFPTAGGPILRFFGAQYILQGLNQSLRKGDTIFYFHPIDMTEEGFPLNTSLKQKLFWLVKGISVENRVRNILRYSDKRICTVAELVNKY